MPDTSPDISIEEALIYVMVTTSAADRTMTDRELGAIGAIVRSLPVLRGFDDERLIDVAESCAEMLQGDDGLERVLHAVAEALPLELYDTAYALAVEVAAADLHVEQEELHFLQMLRDRLDLEDLTVAAIERAARARFRVAS